MALHEGITPDYVTRLINAFGQDDKSAQPLVEPLSKRELEVLSLLNAGASNGDIAEKLVIAVGTVKRHTLKIYQKLGVNSRTQAIAKARELNIL
jgi:LuxR family maltose regulon positive regulatory protein